MDPKVEDMMDPDAVEATVRDIRVAVEAGKTADEILEQHGAFAERCPLLFEKCVAPTFEQRQLECALSLMRDMRGGTKSEYSASVVFGQEMYDKYVAQAVKNQPRKN
jgi:hypothetical protein